MGVAAAMVAALARQGIFAPSGVQAAGIPLILGGANVALQSQTGSGKTLAYLLPILTRVLEEASRAGHAGGPAHARTWPRALVVAPSQELAMQIVRVAQGLLPQETAQAVQQCIGGANVARQLQALKAHRPLLVVGTPGRLAKLVREQQLRVGRCGVLVCDEADRLLEPGLAGAMQLLHSNVGALLRPATARADAAPSPGAMGGVAAPPRARQRPPRQTVVVSATLRPAALQRLASWCPDPEVVSAKRSHQGIAAHHGSVEGRPGPPGAGAPAPAALNLAVSSDPVRRPDGAGAAQAEAGAAELGVYDHEAHRAQRAMALPGHLVHLLLSSSGRDRPDELRRCVHALGSQRALVFVNAAHDLPSTQAQLTARGLQVGCLHAGLASQERRRTLQLFATGRLRVLLVSDVASRGLDLPGVDLVANLDPPVDAQGYAHRAGRTGRMGLPGAVLTLASPGQAVQLRGMLRPLGVTLQEGNLSGGQFFLHEPASSRFSNPGRLPAQPSP